MAVKPLISTLVANQLPDFIQVDFPKFIAFLQAYYRFLELNDKRDFTDLRSIDTTLDAFIGTIKSELDTNGLNYQRSTEQILLKNIKQLYLAKGSEESYKLLFRLLFNKEVSLYYPNDAILRASDGKWQQDRSILVESKSGDVYTLVGKQIQINSNNNKILSFVERVRVTAFPNIYEVFLEKNFYGTIVVGSTILQGTFTGIVRPSLVSYSVYYGGRKFKVGQLFNIKSISGSGLKVKVKRVDSTGAILKLEILSFGFGYLDDIYQTLNPQLNSVNVYSPFSDSLLGSIDSGVVTKPDYLDYSYVDATYVGTVQTEFYHDSSTSTGNNLDEAIIQFKLGALCVYPGYYNGNDGFLSDSIKLQDSYFYQAYSYVIQIDEKLNSYKTIVKNYLHPAGMKLFGEYQINNKFVINTALRFILNFYRVVIDDLILTRDDAFLLFTKILSETLTLADAQTIVFTKALSDSFTVPDAQFLSFTSSQNDTITTSDIISLIGNFARAFVDAAISDDSNILFSTTKAFDDSVTAVDLIGFNYAKYFNDFITPADSGGNLYFNYYTDANYWAPDYTTGSTAF